MPAIGPIAIDFVGVAGAVSLSYGSWLIYRPAGFIVAGVLLLAGSILAARAAP